jgi:hypothetical protein
MDTLMQVRTRLGQRIESVIGPWVSPALGTIAAVATIVWLVMLFTGRI